MSLFKRPPPTTTLLQKTLANTRTFCKKHKQTNNQGSLWCVPPARFLKTIKKKAKGYAFFWAQMLQEKSHHLFVTPILLEKREVTSARSAPFCLDFAVQGTEVLPNNPCLTLPPVVCLVTGRTFGGVSISFAAAVLGGDEPRFQPIFLS